MLILEFGRFIALTDRFFVMVWLLPVLDEIRDTVLEASGLGVEELSDDTSGSPVRSHSEGNGVAS